MPKDKGYPTREEILAELYTPTEIEYNAVRLWKRTFYNKRWKSLKTEVKMDALKELIGNICEARKITRNQWPIFLVSEHPWAYTHPLRTITMGLASPSVISTLHEFAHYLHFSGQLPGEEELAEFVACRYAIGIYKTCFPKSYTKMIWSNHTLVVPKEQQQE
jgi:hypothetical protein